MIRFVSILTLILCHYITISVSQWTLFEVQKTLDRGGADSIKLLALGDYDAATFVPEDCLTIIYGMGDISDEWKLLPRGVWKSTGKGTKKERGFAKKTVFSDKDIQRDMNKFCGVASEHSMIPYKYPGCRERGAVHILREGKGKSIKSEATKTDHQWRIIRGGELMLLIDGESAGKWSIAEGDCIELRGRDVTEPTYRYKREPRNMWKEMDPFTTSATAAMSTHSKRDTEVVNDLMSYALPTHHGFYVWIIKGGTGDECVRGDAEQIYPLPTGAAADAYIEYEDNIYDGIDEYDELMAQYNYDADIEAAREVRNLANLKREKRNVLRAKKRKNIYS